MKPKTFKSKGNSLAKGVHKRPKNTQQYQSRYYRQKHDPIALKVRQGISIVEPVDEPDHYESLNVPSCSHGKCLLFKKPLQNGEYERWFACALHRTSACPFRFKWPKDDVVEAPATKVKKKTMPFRSYLPKKIDGFKKVDKDAKFWFCLKCVDVYSDSQHYHLLEGPFQEFNELFRLLPAMEHEESQAQFWFSDDSLEVIYNSMKNAGHDSFICVGTPQLFQYLVKKNEKAYLLDIDERFRAFFSNDQFAMYNMVNGEFHSPREGFEAFMKDVKLAAIVCDPPFATFFNVLIKSMKDLLQDDVEKVSFTFTLPFFLDKFVFRDLPEAKMVDFAVTYSNHPKFKSAAKTPVRLFTTVDRKHFVLSSPDYSYCKPCDRYVTASNKHCKSCNCCPSRNGDAMKHCSTCDKCYPVKFTHCSRCGKCSLRGRCHDQRLRIPVEGGGVEEDED